MLSKVLIFAIIFLVLIGFTVWVIALLKPKVFPPLTPMRNVTDCTEQELIAARTELMKQMSRLRTTEELARVRQNLEAINQRLDQFKTGSTGLPPSN